MLMNRVLYPYLFHLVIFALLITLRIRVLSTY